uniref:ABM domain-containing protein n=1 Tax=Thermorudis sp. TaxID=1969470 RepID=A0A7C2WJM3_9BACT
MFARVTTYQGRPGQAEQPVQRFEEARDRLDELGGFEGAYFLFDQKTGKAMTITFWESEEAMRASAAAIAPLRDTVVQALGATQPPVIETYEVTSQF